MRYVCTLIVVKDLEKSKQFYKDILEQEVISDLGANVTLTGGFSLQTADSWKNLSIRIVKIYLMEVIVLSYILKKMIWTALFKR